MLIFPFSHLFEYKNGELYWKSGKRSGLEAGCIENDGYMRVSVEKADQAHDAYMKEFAILEGI